MESASFKNEDFGKDLGLLHEIVVTGRKVGADRVFYSSLAHNAKLLKEIVDYVRYYGEPSHGRAREIMGKNFFGIEEAVKIFGVKPSIHDIALLKEIPFSEEALERSRDTHILIAVFPISIRDIRDRIGKKFFVSDWYYDQFFDNERDEASWQLIRRTFVPNSFSESLGKQIRTMIVKGETEPNARTVVYVIVGHYLNTGERLFENVSVQTSSKETQDGWKKIHVMVTTESNLSIGKACPIGIWTSEWWDNIIYCNDQKT